MGTDIHGIFQAKKGGKWVDVPSKYEEDRDYFLFAWLAGVRNGVGFAGIHTFNPIKPLSEPRGLPADFEVKDEDYHPIAENSLRGPSSKHYEEEDRDPNNPDRLLLWMGDHSHSWLSSREILDAPDQGTVKTGVIPLKSYQGWDGLQPAAYSGDVMGKGIAVIDLSEQTAKGERPNIEEHGFLRIYVRVTWKADSVRAACAEFIEEVRRLDELHGGDVRFVFGFDS